MMHSCAWSGIYGIWAPLLLLHLGGPDAITAYSRADNELWLRHGFNMVYQVLVAVYVIYSSALEGYALDFAIIMLVAGASKYGERTLALWYASDSQIVTSCLPISKYFMEKNVVQGCGYVVMGEKQVQRMIKKNSERSSTEGSSIQPEPEMPSLKRRDKEAEVETASVKGRDIEGGLEAPSREGKDKEARLEAASVKGRGIVTTEDVKNAKIEGRDYNLCLSHALFKMYMRRFVSLYFEEGDWTETRAFWIEHNGKEAFRILEAELKFVYDVLFSKGSGTTFSSSGIALRLVNCVLMGAAGFLILRERKEREAKQMVTYVVISVALLVEGKVQEVVKNDVLVLGKFENVVGGDGYRSNEIHQHCLIATSLKRSHLVWNMAKFFPKADSYIACWHIHKVSVQEEFKDIIFNILKRKCSPKDDSETCRDAIYYFEEDLLEEEPEIQGVMSSHENLEELIPVWHIATMLCYRENESLTGIVSENVRCSIILSRYCAYLLVSRPRLLPVHPDMARIAYMQLVEKVICKGYHGKDHINLFGCTDKSPLGSGAKLARKLLEKEENAMWKLLAEYWARLVIYMVVYNKATFHAECVAGGGEFLSQLWVLVGHMGYGDQSDSAVRKKIESSKEGDRRERRRIKRERLERERRERERLERERLDHLE
ncbi:hypothetical protein SUGI_0134110 [Cryptomeria japonica]|nr:hypothetical protein SUGI_0134110 [Cryptomeria japonica]